LNEVSPAIVVAVSKSDRHSFTKPTQASIRLLTGLGVEGDAHQGTMVKHRHRVAKNPNEPNLRQVHLIHAELHDELAAQGFVVASGEMGENVTTRGIDLLNLPRGARLHLGAEAIVEVTGLRNPCVQIDRFQPGLLAACVSKDEAGRTIRKCGVMSVVIAGGEVQPGDAITVELPNGSHEPLDVV
jgi:MOSC domain-containing protein YiiM